MTGTSDLSASLDTSTVTLLQLAQRVKGIQDALASLGILDDTGNDPFYSNVVLFLKGNGSNNSTLFVDSSANPKSITPIGNTKISTDQSKYGGSSIYFDGSGDLLQLNSTTAFDFGLSNFTIEFWIYPITSDYFLGKGDAATISGSMFSFSSQYGCTVYYNGSSSTNLAISFTLNQWQHIAIVRNGLNCRVYKNGISHSTVTLPAGATLNTVANPLQFGGYAGGFIHAYFDSIRVTNIARYTSAFNPETDTYLD